MERREKLILGLIGIELIFTIALTIADLSSYPFCLNYQGCILARHSVYAAWNGIRLTVLATTAFVALFLIYLMSIYKKKWKGYALLTALIGSFIAIYFISIQLLKITKICPPCLVINLLMLFIFLTIFHDFFTTRKNKRKRTKQ